MSTEPEPQPTPPQGPFEPPVPQATYPLPASQGSPAQALLRDPDRLDGYAPLRTSRASSERPYFAEDTLWEVPDLIDTVRSNRLRKMVDGTEEYELDSYDDEESDLAYLCPADLFLTGKAVRSEIRLKDLSAEGPGEVSPVYGERVDFVDEVQCCGDPDACSDPGSSS